MKRDGQGVTLRLKKNDNVMDDVPVYTSQDQVIRKVDTTAMPVSTIQTFFTYFLTKAVPTDNSMSEISPYPEIDDASFKCAIYLKNASALQASYCSPKNAKALFKVRMYIYQGVKNSLGNSYTKY